MNTAESKRHAQYQAIYNINHITSMASQATQEEWKEGLLWYDRATLDIQKELPSLPIVKSAAIVSALSPRVKWDVNVREAAKVVAAHNAGLTVDDVRIQGFKSNRAKAFKIAAIPTAEFTTARALEILGGNKTKSFYLNLCGDSQAVTIDGHATHIAMGTEAPLSAAKALTDYAYYHLSDLYRSAASLQNVKAYQMQAITWLTYRRIRGIN